VAAGIPVIGAYTGETAFLLKNGSSAIVLPKTRHTMNRKRCEITISRNEYEYPLIYHHSYSTGLRYSFHAIKTDSSIFLQKESFLPNIPS
jgi:hypothetical protein